MLAGEREALLRAVDALCVELGYSEDAEAIADSRLVRHSEDRPWGRLSPEDESLVAGMRWSLAKVAAAVEGAAPPGAAPSKARPALDGAEMVMRGALASGNADLLPSLMPSFVFLVTLPIVDQDKALDLSRRTSELIEQALRREGPT